MFNLPDEITPPGRETGELDIVIQTLDALVESANDIRVDGEEDLAQATTFLRQIDSAVMLVEGLSERFRKPAYEYYKGVNDEKKRQLDGPIQAQKILRNKIREFLVENDEECDDFYTRESWSVEVLDLMALIHMVANGDAPLELLQLNDKFAKKTVGTLKGDMNYDGLKPIPDTVLVKYAKRDGG